MMHTQTRKEPSSFRDPSGFVFYRDGAVYRQINKTYQPHYDRLIASGLYDHLVDGGLLVRHEEVVEPCADKDTCYKTIKPIVVPFISYSYEWCFSQLKDAALTTLEIQEKALRFDMTLKDASAFNIQFLGNKPVFIDTLSFEKYKEGEPWVAYRQFCQHFLAPLSLAASGDIRFFQFLRPFIDGIPLDLASKILPKRTWLDFSLLTHLHLHAASQQKYADGRPSRSGAGKIDKKRLLLVMHHLRKSVDRLSLRSEKTEWGEYYTSTNYSESAFEHKKLIVREFLNASGPASLWDLGANDGTFSRLASEAGINTVAFDIDPVAVEKNYISGKKNKEGCLLPLFLDLTNPSPNLGWANNERMSFAKRGPVDAVMALALIHHLCISNNLPFDSVAESFKDLCRWLIIEFVPKEDSNAQKLLRARKDIFMEYDRANFEKIFNNYFHIRSAEEVRDSKRIVYLMEAKK